MADEAEDAFDEDEAEIECDRDRKDHAEVATEIMVVMTVAAMIVPAVLMGPMIVGVAMTGMVVAVMGVNHGLILHVPEFCGKRQQSEDMQRRGRSPSPTVRLA